MKATAPYSLIKSAGFAVLAALLLSACSDRREASTTTASASSTSGTTANATDTWESIKDYPYDQKADFAAKTAEVSARLEAGAANAKGAESTRLSEARDELRTAATEIATATADTWAATKDRVGRALQKAESAYSVAAE